MLSLFLSGARTDDHVARLSGRIPRVGPRRGDVTTTTVAGDDRPDGEKEDEDEGLTLMKSRGLDV